MRKYRSTIILLIVGFLIGGLISSHFKTPFLTESDFLTEEIEAKEVLFKSFLDEQAYLQSRIVSLRENLSESQASITNSSESANLDLLDELKKKIGLTEYSGRGVEILLDDSPLALREGADNLNEKLVQASDLRDIVNLLFAADASAIAINGQRIIATSPISSIGTTILINNAYTSAPYTITAIGETDKMVRQLMNRSALPEIYQRKEKSALVFDIYVKNQLVVPIFNGDLNADYINLVEE